MFNCSLNTLSTNTQVENKVYFKLKLEACTHNREVTCPKQLNGSERHLTEFTLNGGCEV